MKSVTGGRARRFSPSIALVGSDGTGKSSIAKALVESSPVPMKYIYMGSNIDSSNVALPTSRWIYRWKISRQRKALLESGQTPPEKISLHSLEHRIDRHGRLWGGARLLNRIAEEIYRQIISGVYQLRGVVVLYDRYFLFDACPVPDDIGKQRLSDRVHCWFLRNLYPRPGLVILLDAPVDVLYSRKQEVPKDYLESNRRALRKKLCYAKKAVVVDASRSFDAVLKQVSCLVRAYCEGTLDERDMCCSPIREVTTR